MSHQSKRQTMKEVNPQMDGSMQIILYISSFITASRNLIDIIHGIGDTKNHECYNNLESFINRLRKPMGQLSAIVILCPANASELTQLTGVGHLLRDMRVILLLPEAQRKTISDGHMLRPRFIGYTDGDLNDVAAVVKKMAGFQPQPSLLMAHS
jgi:hypothetical protein